MGVDGLWKLLDKCGEPISLETLENRILAIDTSIWLNQAVKGIRDRNGIVIENAHLLGIFNRICKLLHFKIKPVFVFDGGVPALKRQTIQGRLRRNQDQLQKNHQKAQKIVKSYLEKQLGRRIDTVVPNVALKFDSDLFSSNKVDDNLFSIPSPTEIPSNLNEKQNVHMNNEDIDPLAYLNELSSDSDDEFKLDLIDTDGIDIYSEAFDELPPEIKHNILTGLKDKRKYTGSSEQFVQKDGLSFSKYQLDNMMKGWEITKKVEKVQEELIVLNSGISKEDFPGYTVLSKNVVSDTETKIVYIKKNNEETKTKTIEIKPEDYGTKKVFNKPLHQLFGTVAEFDFGKTELIEKDGSQTIIEKEEPTQALLYDKLEKPAKEIVTLDQESSSDDDFVEVDQMEDNSIDKYSFSECNYLLENVPKRFIKDDNLSQLEVIKEQKELNENELEESVCSNNSKRIISNCSIIHSPVIKHIDTNETGQESSILDDSILNALEHNHKRLKTEESSIELIHIEECENDTDIICIDNSQAKESIDSSMMDKPTIENELELRFTKSNGLILMSPIKKSPSKKDNLINSDLNQKNVAKTINDKIENNENGPEEQLLENEKTNDKDINKMQESENTDDQREIEECNENGGKFAPIFLNSKQSKTIEAEKISDLNVQPSTSKQNTQQEKEKFDKEIDKEIFNLRNEIKKVQRQTNSVHKNMIDETKELLDLFGIPYIVSPMEAEAQCASLEMQGLTEGTITDDSDVWLFGARTVYKNFFNQSKFVLRYQASQIEREMKLTRENLICLAMLCGSDYTDGIHGIGPITAVEIISEFKGEQMEPLQRFQQWWANRHDGKFEKGNRTRNKLMKYDLPDSFPNSRVYEAYCKPLVHSPAKSFEFGRPDLDLLRNYTYSKFKWSQEKADKVLLPVFKRLNEKQSQLRIDKFFQVTKKKENLFESSRLKNAINKIDNQSTPENNDKRKKGTKKRVATKKSEFTEHVPTLKTKVKNQKGTKIVPKNQQEKTGRQTRLSGIFKQAAQQIDLSDSDSD